MRRSSSLFASVGVLLAQAASGACLNYEPQLVTVAGTVVVKVFPGPPNYESVAAGDAPERTYILQLAEPICVSGQDLLKNGPVADLRELQLVLPADAQFVPTARVRVRGTLFGRQTGHHRTPVLMHVVRFERAT